MLVMDNLAPHKAASVRAALRQAGLERRYLPAYSPDLNPMAFIALAVGRQAFPLRRRSIAVDPAHRRELRGCGAIPDIG